jgi:hypothetical protein
MNTIPQLPPFLNAMIIVNFVRFGMGAVLGLIMAVAPGKIWPFFNAMIDQAMQQASRGNPSAPTTMPALGDVGPAIIAAMGIGVIISAGIGFALMLPLRNGRNWARILWIIFTLLALPSGLMGLAGRAGAAMWTWNFLNLAIAVAFLYALFRSDTADFCRQ